MIVVDASLLANVVGDEGPAGEAARNRVERADAVAAPDLVDVETVAALRRRWLAGDLTERRFQVALDDLGDLPIVRYPALPLLRRAYELRANVTAHDAMYVALAEGLECPLVTTDARLANAPGPRCKIELMRP